MNQIGRRGSHLRHVLYFFAAAVLASLSVPARAQTQRAVLPADTLIAADYEAGTFVGRPALERPAARGTAAATFDLDLRGFPDEAEAAFAFAAAIWSEYLDSAVPIRVRAEFSELEERTLGAAGPACVESGPDLPRADTWYPIALAEALLGDDLNPAGSSVCPGVDITATFNSALDVDGDGDIDWYYGTDGNTPRGTYDFVTVVLHELGHGLGFLGTFNVVTDGGEIGCPDALGAVPVGQGCWGIGGSGDTPLLPIIFDRFAEDESGTPLLDEAVYPNPSLALGTVLQSERVVFDGPGATVANTDIPIDLFAPSNFEPGSSFSHFDEETFPPGEPNSLLTPQLARSEAIFSPGPLACAVFEDIGWRLGASCRALLTGGLVSFDASAEGDDIVLRFLVGNGSAFVSAIVEREGKDGVFEPVDAASIALDPATSASYTVRLADLGKGIFTFRLRLIRADGSSITSASVTVNVLDGAFALDVFPNPFGDEATVRLVVAEDQKSVRVTVYDVLGRLVADLTSGEALDRGAVFEEMIDGRSLAAGVYFVRVEGETFETTRTITHIRR